MGLTVEIPGDAGDQGRWDPCSTDGAMSLSTPFAGRIQSTWRLFAVTGGGGHPKAKRQKSFWATFPNGRRSSSRSTHSKRRSDALPSIDSRRSRNHADARRFVGLFSHWCDDIVGGARVMEFFQGADPRTRSIVLAGLAGIAIGVTVGIIVPAGLGWDFAVFYDAGRS